MDPKQGTARPRDGSRKATSKSSHTIDAPPGRGGELTSGGAMSMGPKSAKDHNPRMQQPSRSTDQPRQDTDERNQETLGVAATSEGQSSSDARSSHGGPEPEGSVNQRTDPHPAPLVEVSLHSHGGQEEGMAPAQESRR